MKKFKKILQWGFYAVIFGLIVWSLFGGTQVLKDTPLETAPESIY